MLGILLQLLMTLMISKRVEEMTTLGTSMMVLLGKQLAKTLVLLVLCLLCPPSLLLSRLL
jgi:hypothetical protein